MALTCVSKVASRLPAVALSGNNLGPWASCSHTCTSVTKQYRLVPVKGGDVLRLGS